MKQRSPLFHLSTEDLIHAVLDVLQSRDIITLEEVVRVAEAQRQQKAQETAAVFMMDDGLADAPEAEAAVEAPVATAPSSRANSA